MKAKEYAAILVGAESAESYENTLFAFLDELVGSTIAQMKTRGNSAAVMACVRETFTKWKSIVVHVKASKPELVIDDALFPKYFSHASPPLFAMALEAKAFLGYTPDAEDRATAKDGKNTMNMMAMREKLAELQREARLLGIPVAPLLVSAIRFGEI